ncbi:hypothetical protein BP6252_03521 [Coleophoma cylindrospora]|uniref:TauD/TfdA-like domain-containing protein n=1 Tax=Coleophoma cylindrospora TaxID=1849047 RepID=A0A3D8S7X4_9HELO|nr:hypothetical protein BP6252_03521 [Coleophoma cylindrospora]
MAVGLLEVKPFEVRSGSEVRFGASVNNIDLERITDDEFALLRKALYGHNVLLIKNQQSLSPEAQYRLTRRFDPGVETYSHGTSIDKRSVLHADLKTIPRVPQVQVIGNGHVPSFEGLKDITLEHPHHRRFHKHVVPEEEDLAVTHFYRWHIDSAMYALNPPRVTSLMAVQVPKGRRQLCRYDDGSGEEMEVPLGTTAFFSGYTAYEILSVEQKEFVRGSSIEYAGHPYIWMSKARSRSNGLGLWSEERELTREDLPPIEADKVKIYPMVWKNPVTGRLALMVYPTPMRRIHLRDGSVMEDLAEVRELVYQLQRPAISPQYIYAHDWAEGDLVLFNNHGVMHSIVGAFAKDEVRLFRQCNMAASTPPLGPDDE